MLEVTSRVPLPSAEEEAPVTTTITGLPTEDRRPQVRWRLQAGGTVTAASYWHSTCGDIDS